MRIPNPIATTTTEAYLAYKAGVLAQADLKEKLYHPYIHIDGWLAYWTGLTDTYPTDKNGDPECLTDEEAYIAYLAGVTSEYPEALKDPADPRMAGYLKYLISARFGRPNYPVTREELYLSMMKPPVVPSGDPSSSIDLEGTIEYPFISMEMYGDTSQKSYSGKNLLPYPYGETSKTEKGITYAANSDGTVTIDGTFEGTGSAPFYLLRNGRLTLPAGTYYFPNQPTGIAIVGYDGNNYFAWSVNNGYKVTLTSQTTFTSIYLQINSSSPIQSFVNATAYPMLTTAANPTIADYEPYVGGIPSPNPDYPQAVQTVTGRQMVAVTGGDGESAEYEINLGKNLRPNLGITGAAAVYRMNNALYYKLSKGTYTVSFKTTNTTANIRPLFYIQDMQRQEITSGSVFAVSDGFTYQNNGWGKSSGRYLEQTFTLLNDYYVQVVLVNYNSSVGTASDMQIEKGSTATDYAPYFDPIELCKIGDYQDYIYRDGEDWYVHKEVERVSLAISDMDNSDTYPGWKNQTEIRDNLTTATSGNPGQLDRFTSYITNITGLWEKNAGGQNPISTNFNSQALVMLNNGYWNKTQTEWKSEYPDLVVELYYGINVEERIENKIITNSALIAQLDALMEGGSYDGETHIRVSATDPNLPALLKVEAAK